MRRLRCEEWACPLLVGLPRWTCPFVGTWSGHVGIMSNACCKRWACPFVAAGLNPRQPNTKCATVKIASPASDPTTVPLMRMY